VHTLALVHAKQLAIVSVHTEHFPALMNSFVSQKETHEEPL